VSEPSENARRRRLANQALLILVPLAVLTGLFSNMIGTDWLVDPATVHGIVALGVVLVSPWKSIVIRRGLGRAPRTRWVSLALLAGIAATVLSGLLHAAAAIHRVGPLTLMQVHVGSGIIAVALLVAH